MPKDDTSTFPEYADEYIGECVVGSCDSPATVQLHGGFMHCALHALGYEIGYEIDEMNLCAGLLRGFEAQAVYEGRDYVARALAAPLAECEERVRLAESWRMQVDKVDREVMPNHDLRTALDNREHE